MEIFFPCRVNTSYSSLVLWWWWVHGLSLCWFRSRRQRWQDRWTHISCGGRRTRCRRAARRWVGRTAEPGVHKLALRHVALTIFAEQVTSSWFFSSFLIAHSDCVADMFTAKVFEVLYPYPYRHPCHPRRPSNQRCRWPAAVSTTSFIERLLFTSVNGLHHQIAFITPSKLRFFEIELDKTRCKREN